MIGLEVAVIAACALPLLAALTNGVNALGAGCLYGPPWVARVAVAGVGGSFAASVWAAVVMTTDGGPHEIMVYRWIASGDLAVDFGFLVDELTIVMMLVVTAISWLVAYFSVNYMHNEPGFARYFTVVPLFVFAMLVLVMADNYLLMFLGWEGVGVCSYLLIGFYHNRKQAAQAATRAFIMNRVGDAGLLLAMFLLVVHTGSLRFADVFAAAGSLSSGVVTGICLLLLWGAVGKSAQLPLGTWLARAMEGPTPSSALIHAATMVTAGVYLVVRSSPLFDVAPTALLAVGLVGAMTALYGQLVGYVQTDVKGLLAASTTAQLGVMFVFCGLGLYTVAIFHLVAHAFYKSYLFLTAPSILHHLHGGADPGVIRRPADTAPVLYRLVLATAIGSLMLPLLARAVVDDQQTLGRNAWPLAALAVVAGFSVVFGSARMVRVGFGNHQAGGQRADRRRGDRDERLPAGQLAGPMLVLVALLVAGWFAGILPGGIPGSWFYRLLEEVVAVGSAVPAGNPLVAGLFLGGLGLLAASGVFGPRFLDRFRDEMPADVIPPVARRLYWGALDRGLIDETYRRFFVSPTVALGLMLRRLDRRGIDRATSAVGSGGRAWGVGADWESRFESIRQAHDAGFVTLAEPPERLDWLPSLATPAGGPSTHPDATGERVWDTTSTSPRPGPHGRLGGTGIVEGAQNTVARFAEQVERVVFQGSAERGVAFVASAVARMVEAVERVVFQVHLEQAAARLTSVIARFTEVVEHVVFQSGVDRGVFHLGTTVQRALLAFENRLGRPLVMTGLLLVVLVVLVGGTR